MTADGKEILVTQFRQFVTIQNATKRLIEVFLMFAAANRMVGIKGVVFIFALSIYFSAEARKLANFAQSVIGMTINHINQNQTLKNGLIGK